MFFLCVICSNAQVYFIWHSSDDAFMILHYLHSTSNVLQWVIWAIDHRSINQAHIRQCLNHMFCLFTAYKWTCLGCLTPAQKMNRLACMFYSWATQPYPCCIQKSDIDILVWIYECTGKTFFPLCHLLQRPSVFYMKFESWCLHDTIVHYVHSTKVTRFTIESR